MALFAVTRFLIFEIPCPSSSNRTNVGVLCEGREDNETAVATAHYSDGPIHGKFLLDSPSNQGFEVVHGVESLLHVVQMNPCLPISCASADIGSENEEAVVCEELNGYIEPDSLLTLWSSMDIHDRGKRPARPVRPIN